MIPARGGAGGTTLLETLLLITACRLVEARSVFEFGTFLGTNTFNLAMNTPEDGRVFTLDIGAQDIEEDPADAPLTRIHRSAGTMDFTGSNVAHKIERLAGDSRTFDFSRWTHSVDLLFIDGGHDLATLHADTKHAMEMAATDRPSCVVWHDYGNPEYPPLTAYLEELSNRVPLFHLEDTMLCAWFNDPRGTIVPPLS